MNAVESWNHLTAPVYVDAEGQATVEDLGDGWRYQAFHVQGYFGRPFDVRAYPFDSQDVLIAIEDTDAAVEEMTFVADDTTHSIAPSFEMPGWDIAGARADVIERVYVSNFGEQMRTRSARRAIARCPCISSLPPTTWMRRLSRDY